MITISHADELRAALAAHRKGGRHIGLVPTMGNLHAGHRSLVDIARTRADVVVATVFVNPTQFGPNEDFTRYPRTAAADEAALEQSGCDLLFMPTVETMYPLGIELGVRIHVPALANVLEGALRPGHFDGVATVVAKLFNLVQPDLAVFGRKDYQQMLVVRALVADLCLPIEIVAAPIVRAANGLALSSRNQFLDTEQLDRAGAIHAVLNEMIGQVRNSSEPLSAIELAGSQRLVHAGLQPDYVTLRRAADLETPHPGERDDLVALIAARLGSVRLID
ncbi:MAG: pantoate--beta-alanine ligase, partial [Dokdonella sp.]